MSKDTRDKILEAALKLFSIQGYSDVTTKAIANAAGVNEVTVFRLFGKKKNLYIEVFNKFSIKPSSELLLKNIKYELVHDLEEIGKVFVELFLANSKIVNVSIKAVELEIKEIAEELKQQIEDIGNYLKPYFEEMYKQKKINGDPQFLAILYTDILFAYAVHILRKGNLDYLSENISSFSYIFARGIKF